MSLSFRNRLEVSCSDSSFREIRTNNGFYVDKTEQIYDRLGFGKYFFLTRPRRFGKSLLCSTLKELFSGNRDLFKGLWIEQSDWKWDSHPIIHLDMTSVSSGSSSIEALRSSMLDVIYHFAQEHEISLNLTIEPARVFSNLIVALHKKYGKRVVVIIDEYDKPLTTLIDQPDAYAQTLQELKAFYGQLKSMSEHLRFVFITGVFKFAQAGIFSDLNNLTDLTFDPRVGTLLGYTQEELETNFDEGIDALAAKLGKSRDEMLGLLKDKYNGYHFGHDNDSNELSPGVYNPFGINHTFAANALLKTWFQSGNPTALIKKIRAEECQPLLHQNLVIKQEALTSSISPATITPLSMLYYAGYLTINSYDPESSLLTLVPPNIEVSQAFSNQLISELVPRQATAITTIAVAITKLLQAQSFDLSSTARKNPSTGSGRAVAFTPEFIEGSRLQDLLNQALANIGYQLLLSREDQYQLAFFMLFNSGGLRTRVEDVTQDGRIDIVIEMRHCLYIIELKIEQPAAVGIEQIKAKDYVRKFKHMNLPVWAIGIKLAGKKEDETAPRNAVLELATEIIAK